MIGRQIKGRGFGGLVRYLAGKPGAEIVAGTMDGRTPRALAAEFSEVRRLRPQLRRAVFHMPVRPAPGETLTALQWRAVAERLAAGMGFANSPWVAYLHRDAREEHLHLVASRVTYDGRAVSDRHDYRRGMALLRQLERELGLSIAPAPGAARKPAGQAERQSVPESFSVRLFLQSEIARAAEGRPALPLFVERLERAGIDLLPAIDARGAVRGVAFRARGLTFPGSRLGAAYSWPGVQARLGVEVDLLRDAPLLAALRARGLSSPHALADAPDHSPAKEESAMADLDEPRSTDTSAITLGTLHSIRRQLRALGAERVDLLLVDAKTGERESRLGLSLNDVERSLDWLRHRNARGAEVLIRPTEGAPSVPVVDVPKDRLDALARRGLEPAAVVEVGAGERTRSERRFEVWLRHDEPLTRAEADLAASLLALEIRGRKPSDVEPALARYGHLAGFTTPLLTSRDGERASFAELRRGGGAIYEREAEIRDEVRALLLERSGADRIPPLGRAPRQELDEAIEREARDPRNGLGVRSERSELPAAATLQATLERDLAAWRAARDRYLALATADLEKVAAQPLAASLLRHEIDRVEAYRGLREIEARLEEATGLRPLPAHLDASDLARAAELGGRFGEAQRDADAAVDRWAQRDRPEIGAIVAEREAALRQRAEEAIGFETTQAVRLDPAPAEALVAAALAARPPAASDLEERSTRLRELVDALGRDPGPVELGQLREAWSAKLDLEIAVEAWRADLGRVTRALAIERDDVAVRLERFERDLGPEPSTVALARLDHLRERLDGLDGQLEWASRRLAEADLVSNERTLERIGLGIAAAPDEPTVWDRAGEPFRAYAERLAERRELLEETSGRDPALAHEIPPLASKELGEARAALARASGRLIEERTPAAIAAYREAAERVGALESAGRDRAAEVELRDARHLLRRALGELEAGTSGPPPPEAAARLRSALDRVQTAEERLASRIPAARAPEPRQTSKADPTRSDPTRSDPERLGPARSNPPRLDPRRSDERFAALLERVRRGDLTPETLERLRRAAEHELRAQRTPGERGAPVRGAAPVESKRDLLASVERFRRTRFELDREIHGRRAPLDRRDPDALERLLPLLARHQEARAHLDQVTDRFLGRTAERARDAGQLSRLLPLRYFLRHPEYRTAPHRAVAAWARHAAERGRSAPEIRAQLARQPRVNLARPSALGKRFVGRMAFWGVRWAGRMVQQLVHDEVRSR